MGNGISYVEYTIFYLKKQDEEEKITGEFRSSDIKSIVQEGDWCYRVELQDGTHQSIDAHNYKNVKKSMEFESDQLTKELESAEKRNIEMRTLVEKLEKDVRNIQEEIKEINKYKSAEIDLLLILKNMICHKKSFQ